MRKLLLLLSMCMAVFQLFAQSRTVTGTVTDQNGAAVVGASVQVKGGTAGTITSASGTFTLNVPSTAKVLVISSLNFTAQEVQISSTPILVKLAPGNSSLDEIVVTGYQTMRKKDVTAAISRISAADIENLPMPTFAQAMQGRAAGVSVSASNGIPGGSLSVVIRGVGSINAGTTPLYVVDGIQLNTGVGSINTQNNPLSFLNPDDIESIEILKDAAAASIYGARAANGVVLVTTKKGKSGKVKFNANVYYGESSPLVIPKVLSTQDWYKLRYEAIANANPTMTAAAIDASVRSTLGISGTAKIDSLPTYDWQAEAYKRGKIATAELSMQGGSENIQYYVSGSYSKQTVFIQPTSFERGSLLSKFNFKISKKFTLENQISLSTILQNAPYSTGNTGFGNPAYAAGMMLPNNPIYNANGTYFGLPGSGQTIVGTFNHNILAIPDYVDYKTRTNQLIGNMSLSYNPTTSLTFKTLLGLDYRLTQDHRYQDPRVNDAFAVSGRLSDQVDWNTNFISTTTGNYRKVFGDHSLNALLGVEFRRDVNQWFQADGQGFPSYQLRYLSAAATPVGVSGAWTASATFSQFAKLGYIFRGKYNVNYTVRRDGSSRFGENNKYGVFQSAQAGWNIKEESFLKSVTAINELKIRYAYGQAGNDQIGNTLYAQLYGAARLYGNGSAINPTQLGNPDLTWELREEHNIGIDAAFFNNRLSLTVDAYRKVNKDLLLSRALYSTTGFTSITQNLGSVENKGLEIMVSGTPLKSANFSWTASFNIAFQKNKMLSLYDGLTSLPSDATIQVGVPLGSFFTSEWAGVNPATGRSMWYDKNGDYTYNPTAADRKIIGSIYPKAFGGLNNSLSYKSFSLEVFFQYEYGRTRVDGQFQQMMRMAGATVNTLQYGFDTRWQKPGDIVETPRAFNGLADFNSAGWGSGSRYLFKTDYIRLKQITLSYDLPKASVKRFGIDGARFYVQGINLWTYTKWLGYDPEFTGDNFGIIPQSKNITAGLQVKF